jgi:uroporphyrinogen-III decarboxylase
VPLRLAREAMGRGQVLLGNIEPAGLLRHGTAAEVSATIAAHHAQAGARYIVGAGCEVTRDTPAANLHALARYAHDHR